MNKFKVGDIVRKKQLIRTHPEIIGTITSITDQTFEVQYSDEKKGHTYSYSELDIDDFWVDQELMNEQEMKKLLGVK